MSRWKEKARRIFILTTRPSNQPSAANERPILWGIPFSMIGYASRVLTSAFSFYKSWLLVSIFVANASCCLWKKGFYIKGWL